MPPALRIPAGLIAISDVMASGIYADLGAPALGRAAERLGFSIVAEALVTREAGRISRTVHGFARQGCRVILTLGGAGFLPDERTPEAVPVVARVEIPILGELLRREAVLSCTLLSVVQQSLVLGLPDQPAAVAALERMAGPLHEALRQLDADEAGTRQPEREAARQQV